MARYDCSLFRELVGYSPDILSTQTEQHARADDGAEENE
jgi:hypothetical protein